MTDWFARPVFHVTNAEASLRQTIRTGLELVAAGRAYQRLLQLRGKVHFSRTLEELKADC